jgi:DNA-binding NarL/FixJ family response regulator
MGDQNSLSAKGTRIKVMVAESTPLTSRLFADGLRRRGFVVDEASGTDVAATATALKPNVVLLSENLEGTRGRGLEVLKQFQAVAPKTDTVVLLDLAERDLVVEAFRSGARGVFCRNEPVELLAKCVRRVCEGQLWINSTQLGFLVDALADAIAVRLVDAQGAALLSKREQDVVGCLAKGYTNAQIARELKLSKNTVKNYMFRIFDKLGVSSRVELVRYVAARCGLEAAES